MVINTILREQYSLLKMLQQRYWHVYGNNMDFNVRENVDLQPLNTLAVPAMAKWFVELESEKHIGNVLSFLEQKKCELLVLGGGSNIVLPECFPGLVLKNALMGKSVIDETKNDIVIEFSAGENWHDAVMWCVEQDYHGIENLALIPGTVGAAPIQNIGAYGVELASCFEYLEAVNLINGVKIRLNKNQCEFAYRDSIFKNRLKDKMIITTVALRLYKKPMFTLDYPALSEAFTASKLSLTAQNIAQTVMSIRRSKLPDPADIPNAGSFFKNPVIDKADYERLHEQFSDLVAYPVDGQQYKLAAGWLLDKAGWKGKIVNAISMHNKQALVLTNPQKCNGERLLAFAEQVSDSIRVMFDVRLDIEPRLYLSTPSERD